MVPERSRATRKPRADVIRNRERLIRAAAEVFRTGGAEASLEAVANRAGVGIGTLYRHFPTREALFEAVYRQEVDQLSCLAESLARTEKPVDALRQWLHADVQVIATKRGMLTALALAIDSSTASSTRRSANSCMVQCPRPKGAWLQASATRKASCLGSSLGRPPGRGFSCRARAARPSTKRRRVRSTVAGWICRASAIAASVLCSSAASRMRARVRIRAGAMPLLSTPRSSVRSLRVRSTW